MKINVLFSSLVLVVSVTTGCTLRSTDSERVGAIDFRHCLNDTPDLGEEQPKWVPISFSNIGWHTGIVIYRDHAPSLLLEKIPELKTHRAVEIGWGDREFYMANEFSFWRGFRALFFSAGSAMHIAAFRDDLSELYSGAEIVNLQISQQGAEQLSEYIISYLETTESGAIERLGPSHYGTGSFYPASGKFSILRTCNTWVSKALQQADCLVGSRLRASPLMADVRRLPSSDAHSWSATGIDIQ